MKYFLSLSLILASACSPKNLDASYDIGEELIMTERDTKTLEYKLSYDLSVPLYSIYWNPSNNQYYYVKDGSDLIKTNSLSYKIDPKKEEQVFVEDIKDPYLQFAGYISTNERLYIDKRDKQQYIKLLTPIQDPIEVIPYRTVFKKDGSYSRRTYDTTIDKNEKMTDTTFYEDIHSGDGFYRYPDTGRMPLVYENVEVDPTRLIWN